MPNLTCENCGSTVATFKRACDGDGNPGHHHGMVHTLLRGRTNDLARIGVECGCAERDRLAWRVRKGTAALAYSEHRDTCNTCNPSELCDEGQRLHREAGR